MRFLECRSARGTDDRSCGCPGVWLAVLGGSLSGGGQATRITYEAAGRQYLVIMAGGHHFMETPVGDALVAYSLPQ